MADSFDADRRNDGPTDVFVGFGIGAFMIVVALITTIISQIVYSGSVPQAVSLDPPRRDIRALEAQLA